MAKKNIILMYITEVSGHHSATVAIEKALKILRADAEIMNINAFRYTNPISERIVNRIYTAIIKKTPKIWDYVYDNPKVKNNLSLLQKTLHKMNSPKFKRLFDKFRPDAVVCTQAFPCGMVADYKKAYNSDLPLIAVLTDYVPHSYWIYDNVNYYISPSDEVSQRLIRKGIPAYKIKPFGIPFDPGFNEPVDLDSIRKKLNLTPGLKTVLIMGGGQGIGPIKTIVKSLEKVKTPMQEIVVCGTNKLLYKNLLKKSKKFKNKMFVFGYCRNVNELMAVSDLVITKPGGITTSEALAKKLPMIIIRPIPGQEMNNTAYLTEQQAAIKLENPRKIYEVLDDLFTRPQELKQLADAAGRIAKPNAALEIARFILEQ